MIPGLRYCTSASSQRRWASGPRACRRSWFRKRATRARRVACVEGSCREERGEVSVLGSGGMVLAMNSGSQRIVCVIEMKDRIILC